MTKNKMPNKRTDTAQHRASDGGEAQPSGFPRYRMTEDAARAYYSAFEDEGAAAYTLHSVSHPLHGRSTSEIPAPTDVYKEVERYFLEELNKVVGPDSEFVSTGGKAPHKGNEPGPWFKNEHFGLRAGPSTAMPSNGDEGAVPEAEHVRAIHHVDRNGGEFPHGETSPEFNAVIGHYPYFRPQNYQNVPPVVIDPPASCHSKDKNVYNLDRPTEGKTPLSTSAKEDKPFPSVLYGLDDLDNLEQNPELLALRQKKVREENEEEVEETFKETLDKLMERLPTTATKLAAFNSGKFNTDTTKIFQAILLRHKLMKLSTSTNAGKERAPSPTAVPRNTYIGTRRAVFGRPFTLNGIQVAPTIMTNDGGRIVEKNIATMSAEAKVSGIKPIRQLALDEISSLESLQKKVAAYLVKAEARELEATTAAAPVADAKEAVHEASDGGFDADEDKGEASGWKCPGCTEFGLLHECGLEASRGLCEACGGWGCDECADKVLNASGWGAQEATAAKTDADAGDAVPKARIDGAHVSKGKEKASVWDGLSVKSSWFAGGEATAANEDTQEDKGVWGEAATAPEDNDIGWGTSRSRWGVREGEGGWGQAAESENDLEDDVMWGHPPRDGLQTKLRALEKENSQLKAKNQSLAEEKEAIRCEKSYIASAYLALKAKSTDQEATLSKYNSAMALAAFILDSDSFVQGVEDASRTLHRAGKNDPEFLAEYAVYAE